MPLKDLQIILADNLTPQAIEQIRQAFFPDVDDVATLKRIAFCPWIQGGQVLDHIPVGEKLVRMPYNFLANAVASRALGTRAKPEEARRLEKQWSMWQTASRSCVIRLDSVNSNKGRELDPNPLPSYGAMIDKQPVKILWNFTLLKDDFSVNDNPFDLEYMYDHREPNLPKCYSLKSGLCSIFEQLKNN
jgi:hypothetical protein